MSEAKTFYQAALDRIEYLETENESTRAKIDELKKREATILNKLHDIYILSIAEDSNATRLTINSLIDAIKLEKLNGT